MMNDARKIQRMVETVDGLRMLEGTSGEHGSLWYQQAEKIVEEQPRVNV